MLCGDFNSRSSNLEDIVQADAYLNDFYGNFELTNETFQTLQCFERNNISIIRENADRTVNAYGYKMAEFCKNNDIFILNGRIGQPGTTSKVTCKDRSTIDYVLMTPNCFDIVHSFFIDELSIFRLASSSFALFEYTMPYKGESNSKNKNNIASKEIRL